MPAPIFDSTDYLLMFALFLVALGGAMGTGAVVIWLRNAFREELKAAWTKMDAERETWMARERGYLERITRLETIAATLTERLDRAPAALTVNAGKDVLVGGDVAGRDKGG